MRTTARAGDRLVHVLDLERKPGRWDKSEIARFRALFDAYRKTMDPIIKLIPTRR